MDVDQAEDGTQPKRCPLPHKKIVEAGVKHRPVSLFVVNVRPYAGIFERSVLGLW